MTGPVRFTLRLDFVQFQFQISLFGPRIFTIVNLKQRPTTTILSYATTAHALNIVVVIPKINE